ncbi:MAG: FtsL-like putative cell division protein [Flavobacteriales bacterium]|nr:FtsL-like putative cell division protein [Flavobacteriales bacterium]MDG1781577.1 FtsL-like putative cell division protein [Flavobacteriales bacterium]MDG2246357.1 FtsL-like putative cell division protein [Flavobacteriales bacterium]
MKNEFTTKKETQEQAPKKKGKFSKGITNVLSGEFLSHEGVMKHAPFLLYLTVFFLLYIYIGFTFEDAERDKQRIKGQLEEMNAEYKTLKSELEAKKRQSSVAADIQRLNLEQPNTPPLIIEVNPESFEEHE